MLISIIIPTKNNERTIRRCLTSCLNQTHPEIEIIVIDNFSTDLTPQIARDLGIQVISAGPERHQQRPRGAEVAQGQWLAFIDADMYLAPKIMADAITQSQQDPTLQAFILPEVSIGEGFWAQCKILERTFYQNYPPMLAARLIHRQAYEKVGGWDPTLITGEDFDLHDRLVQTGINIGSTTEIMRHDEGHIRLWPYLQKKYYYGQFLNAFLRKSKAFKPRQLSRNIFFLRSCFYRDPKRILSHPLRYLGMWILLALTQIAYLAGLIGGSKKTHKPLP